MLMIYIFQQFKCSREMENLELTNHVMGFVIYTRCMPKCAEIG